MKIEVEYLEYMWPMRHFLVTCGNIAEKSNIITVSFCMPVSKEPPLIAIAIGKDSYSYELIKKTNDFIINIPKDDLKGEIYYCGFNSGYNGDKFKETYLTKIPSRKLKVPIIDECIAHIECVVTQEIITGDKVLFIGKAVDAYADQDIVRGNIDVDYAKGKFPKKIYSTRFKDN